MRVSNHRKKWQIPFFGYFRVFKEYPQKSPKKLIWISETSTNQGTWLGIPWLGLVSLCQIWDFCGYFLNTLKYPVLGICYFFLWIKTTSVSSQISQILNDSIHKGDGFSTKTLGESLLFKTDLAMVWPASSDFWKADPVSSKGNICSIWQSLSWSFKIIYSRHYQLNCFRSYYSVVVGWCFYYLFRSIFYHLPNSIQESSDIWNNLQVTSENNFGFG